MNRDLLFRTGCEIEILLNFWLYGKNFIIRILTVCNSRRLEWRKNNLDKKGNIREYADLKYLLVLANMESYNAVMIEQGKSMSERLVLLHDMAKKQLKAIEGINLESMKRLSIEKKV